MIKHKLDTGSLLVAEPFMEESNFRRSVILITDHTAEDGTVGFIINKPLKINISELVEDFPEFDSVAYYGGPVSTNTIHYIHNVGPLLEGSTEIVPGVYWGGDFENLKFLISQELIKPDNIRFYIGYSGWSAGQLMQELEASSWITSLMDPNYIFKSKPARLWRQVMYHKGNVYSVLSQLPEHQSLN
jgi:putative transcriptional regulator